MDSILERRRLVFARGYAPVLDCAHGHQEKESEEIKVEEVQKNRRQEGNSQDDPETSQVCDEEPYTEAGEEEGLKQEAGAEEEQAPRFSGVLTEG